MKSSTARATSRPATRTTNGAASTTASRDRTPPGAKSSTMSPEPSPPTGQRRSTPIRQSPVTSSRTTSSAGSRRASPQRRSTALSPPTSSPLDGTSPSNGGPRPTSTTRRQSSSNAPSTTVKGFNSGSQKKQILSHDFLTKTTPKARGASMLTRSIDETTGQQLRRYSAPPSKPQFDYMSKSQDHGSLYRSSDRGPKSLSSSQDRGPRSLSSSLNKGPGSLSKSQDRGSLSGYASQGGARKVTVPAYGFDGRRLSTGSRDVTSHRTIGDIKAHYQGGLNRRDGVALQLQMGRSVDSTVSLSTAASSSQRQSFRDSYSERGRLSPLLLSDPVMSQGYRSGDLTPEETSPLDARAPASGLRTRHRQLKSPDFFDVKKVDGDVGGVITAVSRMHYKSNGVGHRMEPMALEPEDLDPANAHKQQAQLQNSSSERTYSGQSRRDSLAGSARKAFSTETDSAIGSSHFSEINYKLEKELSGAPELLEIGSWNEDDDEYLRIYKGERSAEGSFVDILEDTTSESGVGNLSSSRVDATSNSVSPGRAKKWAEVSKISEVDHHDRPYDDHALYVEKSELESELGTSTQPSPQASPPRGAASAAKAAAVSRISSTSATSIDLNRSTDTTCSTHSQYDNAFWCDPGPINGTTFRPWNPNREAEMTPVAAPTRPSPELVDQLARDHQSDQESEPVADVKDSRVLTYNDGLERLTSYMKTASQSARKKGGLSDELSSSQASGCFDYLVDFLESQQSITEVLVSAHDEAVKNDIAHSAAAAAGNMTPKRSLDASKLANDVTTLLSNRSIESRITDLGSEASWESGKSRSVQTLGTTGKVMDQITEKVDSLSFDSPKHLSTFKFGLKKTTVGAFETITSSDHVTQDSKLNESVSAPSSRPVSERSFPLRKPQVSCPQSPNLNASWRSPTSQDPSCNPSRTPSQRASSDEKLAVMDHQNGPLSTSTREIKIVSEASVESRREEEVATPAASPSMSSKPPETELPRKASPRKASRQAKKMSVEKKKVEKEAAAMPESLPTEEVPLKDVQMHSRSGDDDGTSSEIPKGNSVRLVDGAAMKISPSDRSLVKHDRDSLSLRLNQANKGGCGCNIL